MSPEKDIPGKIKVFIADDSAFMRTALGRMIESDPEMKVCGNAQNGQEALDKVASLQPDVITLDVEMPGLNGLETLKRIMRDSPRPVIMVSSLTQEGAETTLEALELGAFDYIPKQSSFVSLDIVKIRDELVAKVKAAAESGRRRRLLPKAAPVIQKPPVSAHAAHRVPAAMVALGTSTGGPKALQEILPMLPADLAVPVVIVQHMPKGFTGPFARRLDSICKVNVCEAEQNESIGGGDGLHRSGRAALDHPAAFEFKSYDPAGSCSREFSAHAVGGCDDVFRRRDFPFLMHGSDPHWNGCGRGKGDGRHPERGGNHGGAG